MRDIRDQHLSAWSDCSAGAMSAVMCMLAALNLRCQLSTSYTALESAGLALGKMRILVSKPAHQCH